MGGEWSNWGMGGMFLLLARAKEAVQTKPYI
jgi:hypothetical protein